MLIGFDDTPTGLTPSLTRPATLNDYSQDIVNGIVQAFADPAFHCGVSFAPGPTGNIHPVISVPGGRRVPIKAKRGGPNNATVSMHSIYIRRPGQKSEVPQTAQEWDDLFARCLASRKDEMVEAIRSILSGTSSPELQPAADAAVHLWTSEARSRWEVLIAPLPPDDERRCSLGRYWFSYELDSDLPPTPIPDLQDLMDRSIVRHSGWPP